MIATLATSTDGGPPCPPHVSRFIDALTGDPSALRRLRIAGDDLLQLRRDLLADRTLAADLRVKACREIARRECRDMALILHQCCKRFNALGSGAVFLPRVPVVAIADALNTARNDLLRASEPTRWDL